MDIDIESWASGMRPAIRGLVENLGGDVVAFDSDPLTAVEVLDDFVARLPLDEMETEDWIGLHTDLTAFVSVVLMDKLGGILRAREDASLPAGWEPVIEVMGPDRQVRQVAPVTIVRQNLHPVPQRIPRLIETALGYATGRISKGLL
ncbi:hypothetical protein ACQB60_41010 [Actinomycetota bacterium Odt1-20B]